jgi:hypothetical protein
VKLAGVGKRRPYNSLFVATGFTRISGVNGTSPAKAGEVQSNPSQAPQMVVAAVLGGDRRRRDAGAHLDCTVLLSASRDARGWTRIANVSCISGVATRFMAENFPRLPKPKPSAEVRPAAEDRMPTHQELLADLSPYGRKRSPKHEPRAFSRRTRDYLLTAGVGSAGIVLVLLKLMSNSDGVTMARLAFTAVALFCGLLWYIFFGVMSRY